jgi:hypothetical protein
MTSESLKPTVILAKTKVLIAVSPPLIFFDFPPDYKLKEGLKTYNNLFDMYKFALMMVLLAVAQQQLLPTQATFCWRNSYGRGVGTPVSTCPSGK